MYEDDKAALNNVWAERCFVDLKTVPLVWKFLVFFLQERQERFCVDAVNTGKLIQRLG